MKVVTDDAHPPLLSARGVTKVFPSGTVALRGVDLSVSPGSVHGLIGANGAGKSTLIKLLAGATPRSGGTIRWRGDVVAWRRPAEAQAAGLATVYQNTPLVPGLSVLENVFLSRPGGFWRTPSAMQNEFSQLLDRVGYAIEPDQAVGELSIGARQMVAFLQALATGADLIIMDEPTASLARGERELVFETIRRLAQDGIAFLYVSHFLKEVLDLCDHVTVLRDGRVVLDQEREQLTEERLVAGVVGETLREVERDISSTATSASVLLEATDLCSDRGAGPVSFTVSEGEVVGLAGLLGSGRSEILHAILGADKRTSGEVRVSGRIVGASPAAAVRNGIGLVPEDRDQQGLVAGWEIWRNASLPDLGKLTTYRVLPSRKLELARARRAFDDLSIKAPNPDTPVADLSGGNAQKVVFAKWVYGDARVFLLDEPTAGVDIGAKAEILELIRAFARDGRAVVVVSSEFEELLAVANKIFVVREGRIVAERDSAQTTEQELLSLASGLG